MKNLLLILLIIYSSFSFALTKIKISVVLGINSDGYYPYRWLENGSFTGSDVDMVKEAARRTGITIQLIEAPWKRLQRMIKQGEIDGSVGGWKTTERLSYGNYSNTPLHCNAYSIFVRKSSDLQYSSLRDLYRKRVGSIRGNVLTPAFRKAVKDNKILLTESTSVNSLLQMLISQRIDVVIGMSKNIKAKLALLNDSTIKMLSRPYSKVNTSHLWFSKKSGLSPSVIEKLKYELIKMEKEKVLFKIAAKYGFEYCPYN